MKEGYLHREREKKELKKKKKKQIEGHEFNNKLL